MQFERDAEPIVDIDWNSQTLTVLRRDGSLQSWRKPHEGIIRSQVSCDAVRVVRSLSSLDQVYTLNAGGQVDGDGWPKIAGEFSDLAAGPFGICGIRLDGTLSCRGPGTSPTLAAPSGTWRQVAMGRYFACAISREDQPSCWYLSSPIAHTARYLPMAVPDEHFLELSAGETHVCGLTQEHVIRCWGDDEYASLEPPAGRFEHLAVAGVRNCALASNGKLTCWSTLAQGAAKPALSSTVETIAHGALWNVCHKDLRTCFPWLKSRASFALDQVIDMVWTPGFVWVALRDGRVYIAGRASHAGSRTNTRFWVAGCQFA